MNTITTAATTYTPPSTSVVHNAQVSLTDRSPASVVHLVQYDDTLPIVAVALTANKLPYTVPSGAAVNVRMAKPDGTYVYNPVLGVSENAQTAYIAVTLQMTAASGKASPIIEIVVDGNVAATGTFTMIIDENPVPESAIESTDEFLTIQQILAQVQQAADLVEQNAQNIQDVVDNMDAIQNASANAQAAAASAAAAQQAAQEALGFRTFFSVISPDENGDLDPSRPMTTPAAAAVTVKSRGDRIQSVQVDGFTQQAGTGDASPTNVREISTAAMRMVAVTFDGSADEAWAQQSAPAGYRYYIALPGVTTIDASTGTAFASNLQIGVAGSVGQPGNSNIFTVAAGNLYVYTNGADLATFKQQLASNPLMLWFVPTDESQATGLYIPIQAQGHEYRCEMLELTAPLCDGDNVQSNYNGQQVETHANAIVTVDGTDTLFTQGADGYSVSLPGAANGTVICDRFANLTAASNAVTIPASQFPASVTSLEQANTWAQSNPVTILYPLVTPAVYAREPVTLVAVPYTAADVAAANQLASTPSTLPNIDSSDVPMLLDAAEPEQATPAALAANAIPVAGTYAVSSQDGTTVLVSLKAFQDGGDAATLGGQTLEQLNNTYLTREQLLTLIYPVGSIYMSANNVSPQTFLGGTWEQIQGQFLLAASDDYPAGSTGGEATHTLTTQEMPMHQHGPLTSGSSFLVYRAASTGNINPNMGTGNVQGEGATGNAGGGQPHNNMPPYLAVYMWQRTA